MGEVISLRISEKEKRILEEVAEEEGTDRSAAARELIEYGELYRAIKRYREGEISVGKLAADLEMSVADAMDLLTRFGVKPEIDFDDYLESTENLKEVW